MKTRTRLLVAAAGVAAAMAMDQGEASAETPETPALVGTQPDGSAGEIAGDTDPAGEEGAGVSVTIGVEGGAGGGSTAEGSSAESGTGVVLPADPMPAVPVVDDADDVDLSDRGDPEVAAATGLLPELEVVVEPVALPAVEFDDAKALVPASIVASALPGEVLPVLRPALTEGDALGLLSFFRLTDPLPGVPQSPFSLASWSSMLWWSGRTRNWLDNHQPTPGVPSRMYDSVTGVVSGALNFSDRDGDPLTYEVVGNPSFGTVVVNADGTYTYVAGDAIKANGGTDTFTVRASDKSYPHFHGITGFLDFLIHWGQAEHGVEQTVVINILPAGSGHPDGPDDPSHPGANYPVIDTVTVNDVPRNVRTSDLAVSGHDVNGSPVTISAVLLDGKKGTLTDLGNGQYRYTADAGLRLQNEYTQRVLVVVTDSEGRSSSRVVEIDVEKNELYTGDLADRRGAAIAVSNDGATIITGSTRDTWSTPPAVN
ncbi:Ig-like domain-containing protein [Gordonia sp. (in: high G+C Gram-positive bacteria)]|uniref:Ig-like domain-containing protein n=1 Tax=Gordonia sp. (in: high G+C Gram-positive bacteria) TaxID=84139 RepID=UPI003529362F